MRRVRMNNGQLAELLGVSPETVSRWRNDKNEPGVEYLEPMAKALQLPVQVFSVVHSELAEAKLEELHAPDVAGAESADPKTEKPEAAKQTAGSRRPEDYYDGVLDAAARMNFEVARMILDVRGARRRGADIPAPPVVFTPASSGEIAGLAELVEELRRRGEGRQEVG